MAVRATGGAAVRFGILMERGKVRERPFAALTRFLQTLTEVAAGERVTVFAFEPGDVDVARQRVKATRWLASQGRWATREVGLPAVVWNRYYRKDEEALIRAFMRLGIPLVNEGALSKWDAYEWLTQDSALLPHLPETRLLEGARTVKEMLGRYPVVFLKPSVGSIGRGIVRVHVDPGGLMCLAYVPAGSKELQEIYATPDQLERWVAQRNPPGQYIVQQGLDLAVYEGRPADVRVLAQKDGRGIWRVTGMGCRVAARGRFTANLHTGGQGVPVEQLAEALFAGQANRQARLKTDLSALSLTTAIQVEAAIGSMGELGLDFGVDTAGKIWCIEQNAQPGRGIFEHLGRKDLWETAFRRPVQYARHLATTMSVRTAGHRRHNG
ncbi:MAG TPA: YheC/YheD family protein [Symbiobacteriaceae bacterium]|nr:YheC/YheD family protein [Symbiobacteriaceae bacterium]